MNRLFVKTKELYHAYRQIISYLFFGGCAALVNTICYWLFYKCIGWSNTASTVVAWLAAVLFAFFTNKILVFRSNRTELPAFLGEAISFFGCRVLTGALDVLIMVIAVDCLQWNSVLWKLISNAIIAIINYTVSRFFIFKSKKTRSE